MFNYGSKTVDFEKKRLILRFVIEISSNEIFSGFLEIWRIILGVGNLGMSKNVPKKM